MNSFLLGCNYWDSKSGVDMWKNWDENVIKEDLSALEACGVCHLRVFPNWRDFQPIKRLNVAGSRLGEYVVGENEEYLESNPYGLDYTMIAHFRRFAEIAKKHNMTLTVSIVTGFMSGKMFIPPALFGKHLLTDPEALMWTNKFVTGIVNELSDIDNIVAWDLGNECNNLSEGQSREETYTWAALVRNAILAVDKSRPVISGMHGLNATEDGIWRIEDQGELCDVLTTHPYPIFIDSAYEPLNRMRCTIVGTAQSEYYSGIGKKPCMVQEQGSFTQTNANEEMASEFLRVNALSAWANNLTGYLWWCGMDHILLRNSPYSWCPMERPLGLVYTNKTPKPVGREMKKFKTLLDKLPPLPPKDTEAVCVLTRTKSPSHEFENAIGSYILAKEAGFNITIEKTETKLPEAGTYILPGVKGFNYIYARTWDFLLKQVYDNGSTLFITNDGGEFADFEEVFGLRSNGLVPGKPHTAKFGFGEIEYKNNRDLLARSIGAEVLATNENGDVVFSRNNYGKGVVFLLNIPIEQYAFSLAEGFNPEMSYDFYKIYKEFSKNLTENYIIKTDNPYIGITQSKNEDGSYIVTAINYSDKDIEPHFTIKNGYKTDIVYGSLDKIGKCDAVIMRAYK